MPAGFLENQETAAEGALRETAEEANARVELDELFTMISVPHVAQIHLLFRSRLLDLEFSPGEETLETALFAESEIPWANIAFPTIEMSLRFYFEDRSTGIFQFRCCDIRTSPMEKEPL